MNSDNFRASMRERLIKSYKHRIAEGCSCVICDASDRPLAFHVLEKYLYDGEPAPAGFVPMGDIASMGAVKGSFPVCTKCAPPCPICKLPIDTREVLHFGQSVQARLAVGYCREHIHWIKVKFVIGSLISKIFNSIFKIFK